MAISTQRGRGQRIVDHRLDGLAVIRHAGKAAENSISDGRTWWSDVNMTAAEVMNRELAYEFEDYVTIDLTFGSDTELYWKERASGADANETISTIHVDESTTLTGWVEHDGIIVSLWSDFAAGRTYGFQYFTDGSVRKLIGTISLR